MKKIVFILLAACSFAHAAPATPAKQQQTPMVDKRLLTETYDKNRIYTVYYKVGRATLIQFEEGESLDPNFKSTLLGMGDSYAWDLGVRGNNIALKPTQKLPETNLIIVTTKRTYAFELLEPPKGGRATYIIRFKYPDTEAAKAAEEEKRLIKEAEVRAERASIKINTAYYWKGEHAMLKPTAAYDNGRFTYLVYDHASEIPVFYKVMPDGSEALINKHIDQKDKGTIVLHELIRTVRARLNDQVIEIINKDYIPPKFNQAGSSVPGAVRVDK